MTRTPPGTLSKLTDSAQRALTSKGAKKAKNAGKGSRRSASALVVLAGGAAAAFGGRQLQKRKRSAEPAATDAALTSSPAGISMDSAPLNPGDELPLGPPDTAEASNGQATEEQLP
jgi:hypothetical protein